MKEKKDFLASLAEEVSDGKKGNSTSRVKSFEDYEKEKPAVVMENEYEDEPDYSETSKTIKKEPAKKADPEEGVTEEDSRYFKNIYEQKKDDGLESFQEEKLTKVDKKSVKLNIKAIIALVVILIILGVGSYFLFFAPKITVPDLVGKPFSEANAWIRQNSIETTAVAVNYEYSLDVDKDSIIAQSVEAGKKVKKNTPITFTVSNGADPDEEVDFPDIMNMTYNEIKTWISENHLLKTKVNTTYSDNIPENEVISYELKTGSETEFTRGDTLTINVSRGSAPASQVTVEDVTGKTLAEAQTYAKNKNLTLVEIDAYSETVESGKIISQSPEKGATIKEGAELTVTVSKGKATIVPNLYGYDSTMLDSWIQGAGKNLSVIKKEVYSNSAAGSVIGQSIAAGSEVDPGTVLVVTTSLYLPVLQTTTNEWVGKDYQTLIAKIDEWNAKGSSITAGAWHEDANSTEPAGTILSYTCLFSDGSQITYSGSSVDNGCSRPLPLDAKIDMTISKGTGTAVTTVKLKDLTKMTLSEAQYYVKTNGLSLTEIDDPNSTESAGTIIKQSIAPGTEVSTGTEITIMVSSNTSASSSSN